MPRIPVYTADGRLPGGPLSPDASPLAFNEAAGLSAVAAGLDNASQVATQINLKRASDIATTWGSSTASTIEEESADFLDKNRNSPTIAQDYKVWAKARFDKAKKEAPNEG
jgi:pyruvate-formate lyase